MTVKDLKDLCDKAIKDGADELLDVYLDWDESNPETLTSATIKWKTGRAKSQSTFSDLDEEEIEQINFIRKNSGSPWP